MKRSKRRYNEVDYWKPFADVLAAILLTVLLFTIVLLLYFNKDNKKNDHENVHDPYTTQVQNTTAPETTTIQITTQQKGVEETTEEVETGKNDRAKTAVKVRLVDEKTNKTIRKKNVKFELFTKKEGKVALYTYYPIKTLYDDFKTDENGKFYLPEKIDVGKYYFKQITDIKGYDKRVRTDFNVKKIHDWSNAYEVKIKLGAAKNQILINQIDMIKEQVVANGKYQVVAAEDIETLDGTVRYATGQVVDTIRINDKGRGLSKKLYLGKYQLKQIDTAKYYAAISKPVDVTVKAKSEAVKNISKNINVSKTRYSAVVVDENDETIKVDKAKIRLKNLSTGEERVIETDKSGIANFEELNKNTIYEITQLSTKEGYKYEEKPNQFAVDKLGRINKKNEYQQIIKNRIIRIVVDVKDYLLKFSLGNYKVRIKDSNGKVVDSWNSNENGYQVKGLTPGKYTVEVSGPKKQVKKITVEDKAETQMFNVAILTWMDIGLAVVSLIVLIIILVILLKIRKKISKRIKKNREENKKRKKYIKELKDKE